MTVSIHSVTLTLGNGLELAPIFASLTLDESWSPFAQASVTVTTPADLSLIDPRLDITADLRFTARYGSLAFVSDYSVLYGAGLVSALTTAWASKLVSAISGDPERSFNPEFVASSQRFARLGIRSREVREDGTTVLGLASAEALLQDLRIMLDVGWINRETVRELVSLFFDQFLAGDKSLHTFVLAPGVTDGFLPFGQNTLYPEARYQYLIMGASWWDMIAPFVLAANLRLWCDELGVFQLTPRSVTLPGTITISAAVNLTAATDTISRAGDEWADSVIMIWRWMKPDGVRDTAISVWPVTDTNPSKTLLIEEDSPPPFSVSTPMGERPAALVYARVSGRGHQMPVKAISDYSVTPGQTALITLPDTAPQTGFIQSVSWSFPADEMTITARNLT